MVVVSELTSIFWGVALESSKKYSQTTERPVRISMAALDPFQSHDEKPVSLMIERDGNSYVLCTLQHGKQFQQMLDLEFASGEELTFFIRGKGVIHLSGYVMPEDEFPGSIDDLSDSDADKEDEEVAFEEAKPQLYGQNKKRQKSDEETKRLSKKAKMTVEDVDDDDDSDVEKSDETKKLSKKTKMTIEDIDDDDDDDDTDAEFIEDEAEEESDDEIDDIDDDESDLEKELLNEDSDDELNDDHEEMEAQYQKKVVTVDRKPVVGKKGDKNVADVKPKQAVQSSVEKNALTKPAVQPSSAATSDTSQVSEGKKKRKRNKKKKNKNVSNQQQTSAVGTVPQPTTSKQNKRTLDGGVTVEDIKEGHGPEAKPGKLVCVYYTGRLPNGKIFDSTMTGNGFKFKLGKKEVISGWDVGLSGMKVGGKRKLVVPAKMGYGSQQAGPIPPNSTLFFDVELRAVS